MKPITYLLDWIEYKRNGARLEALGKMFEKCIFEEHADFDLYMLDAAFQRCLTERSDFITKHYPIS